MSKSKKSKDTRPPCYVFPVTCKIDGTTYIGPCCPICQDLAEVSKKAAKLGYSLVKKPATPLIQHHLDQVWKMEPDMYSGPRGDKARPRWMTSYPKEGVQEDGETLELMIEAKSVPPGTIISIQIPECPRCGEIATQNTPNKPGRNWPKCRCGFSWSRWAKEQYA